MAGAARDQSDAAPTRAVTLRSITASAFLPALIYEIGNGAIAPVIALTALADGASPSTAGFLLALLGIGQVLGDIPAATLADRLGDRHAMMVAAGIDVLALCGCLFAPDVLVLGLSLTVIGMCNATYYLCRQSYLIDVVPAEMRARAFSTLGGSHRIGLFIGPFVGAAAIDLTGLRAPFVVAMIAASSAALLLAVIPDVATPADHDRATRGGVSVAHVFTAHRRMFATLGLAVLAVGAVRGSRQTVLPLWAEHIGISAAHTSLIFGVASAVEMALFYPAGKAMDHFGRISIALPSMLILGATMMTLPLTSGAASLTLVAIVMSAGNGIGSGIIMTLGGDAAPSAGRIQFLSIWRVMGDTGNAAGPLIVATVATAWTLAAGIVAVGSTGLLAVAGLAVWVPRYSAFATHAMVLAHREAQADARASRAPAPSGPAILED